MCAADEYYHDGPISEERIKDRGDSEEAFRYVTFSPLYGDEQIIAVADGSKYEEALEKSAQLRPGTVCAKPKDLGRQQIERLIRERVVGRKIDAATFVEELLAIAAQVGELACSPVENRGLRFELAGSEPFEVDLDANRGKLRMLCARLAVLCQESGHDFMPYGGEGTIRRTAKVGLLENESEPILYHLAWKARWTNTPGKHEFTISVMR